MRGATLARTIVGDLRAHASHGRCGPPHRRAHRRSDDADRAPGRHGAGARGQDRVHHRAGAQPDRRRTAAVLRRHGRGTHRRAPIWSRSPTIACRALPTRSTWRISPRTRRSGPRARAASASSASPSSTRPTSAMRRAFTTGRLHVDIVDYPGEWLIDLPLLELSFADWSRQAVAEAHGRSRAEAARPWLEFLSAARPRWPCRRADRARGRRALHPLSPAGPRARRGAGRAGTWTLSAARRPRRLAAADLLSDARRARSGGYAHGTLGAMLERRFESYKAHVVKPFFRDHFARLDRQIVLIDALSALNAGAAALARPPAHAGSHP